MMAIPKVLLLIVLLLTWGVHSPFMQDKRPGASAPIIAGIPDIRINQNSKVEHGLDLWTYTKDADTPLAKMLFNIVVPQKFPGEDSARVKLDMNRYINLSPDPNWTGTEEIVAEANDGTSVTWTKFKVIVVSTETGEHVEAENRARVERKGTWVELSEGKYRWLQSQTRGDSLSLKFKGSFLTVGLWDQALNLLQRYYEGPSYEPLNDWKTYPSGVVSFKVDGKETGRVDLSKNDRKGWNEHLVAADLDLSDHTLEIDVLEGSVNIDKIRASSRRPCELNISVTDDYETPLADIVLKFIQGNQPKVILRTGPDGKAPTFYGLQKGVYSISIEPASNPGYVPPPPRIEENIEPRKLEYVEFQEGQAYRLHYSLKYSNPDLRSLQIIRRPIRTIPSIVKPNEELTIECHYPHQPRKIQAFLFDDHQSWPLEVVSAEYGSHKIMDGLQEGVIIRAKVPAQIQQAVYGLRIIVDEKNDASAQAVKVVADFKKKYRIAHLSDLHIQSSKNNMDHDRELLEIARDISLFAPEFVIMTGDITDSGSRPEYLRFLKALQSFDVPIYVIPGNHDHYFFTSRNYLSLGFDEYEKYLGQKFFSFSYGRDCFIGLDTGDYERIYETPLEGIHAGQWPWLQRELREAAARPKGLLCLFAHADYTAPLPEYFHFSKQMAGIFDANPVNLFAYGHGHVNREARVGKYSTLALETASSISGQFRLIEIKDGNVVSCPVLDAAKLQVQYFGKNDGSEYGGQAFIKNGMEQPLVDIRLRFALKNSNAGYTPNQGRIVETLVSDDKIQTTVVVSLDLLPRSEASVRLSETKK